MESSGTDLTNNIIQTINSIFQSLFSSIVNNVYQTLDDLVFINHSIFQDSIFAKIFGTNSKNGLLLIANSLLIGFVLYYSIKLIYSYYLNLQIERPYQFIFKIIIFGIALNCSYFICEQFIEINSFISEAIRSIGKNTLGTTISFSELINQLNSVISVGQTDFNIFSLDGILKSFISCSLFNLLFSYALRYVMIKIFILLTPFAILSLINASTSWFFKSWFRTLLSLLLLQCFISLILVFLFTIDFHSANILLKLIFVGGMYALIRANSYMMHLIGGISTNVSTNFNSTFFKK